MCGRFTLTTDTKKLAEAFVAFDPPDEVIPRYNIAPSQPVAVVARNCHSQANKSRKDT